MILIMNRILEKENDFLVCASPVEEEGALSAVVKGR